MIFLNVSNSRKIELLKTELSSVEEILYSSIIISGFIPEEFSIDKFEEIFSSLPEEQLNVGKYATYELLNNDLQHYLKIKNIIDLLEKEENGI
jgi:hypothetical protein